MTTEGGLAAPAGVPHLVAGVDGSDESIVVVRGHS
jgi:hypothetical protein